MHVLTVPRSTATSEPLENIPIASPPNKFDSAAAPGQSSRKTKQILPDGYVARGSSPF